MSILPTWPIAIGTLLIGMMVGTGVTRAVMDGRIAKIEKTHADVLRQMAEVQEANQRDARTKEQTWAERVGQVEQEKINENARIADRYAAQLNGLLQRADRRPTPISGMPQATATCSGATGAELSRPDAAVALGIARDADIHRAALAACYSAYDSLK